MDSGRLIFDPSASHVNMVFLGKGGSRGKTLMMSMEDSPKGQPLFFTSSSSEMYDDENYDEQTPEKKRRLSPEQVVMLEQSFETENKLEPERKTELAKKLGLQPRQVAVWFQNRRARWKNKRLEKDFDLLKSSYQALLAEYDSISKENHDLRTQVVSLTEELQAAGNGLEAQAVGPGPTTGDPAATDPAQQPCANTEEPGSSGSTRGSPVANEDDNLRLVESGESYFPPTVGPVDAILSEEDDGSFDGQSCYLPDVLATPDHGPDHVEWSWDWS